MSDDNHTNLPSSKKFKASSGERRIASKAAESKQKDDFFEVSIYELYPTQMCIGIEEVWGKKVSKLKKEIKDDTLADYLKDEDRRVKVVRDAGGVLFVHDKHHLVCGVHLCDKIEEKDKKVYVVLDYISPHNSATQPMDFWKDMLVKGFAYMVNEYGVDFSEKAEFSMLPSTWQELCERDNPWRSVVYACRKSKKNSTDGLFFKDNDEDDGKVPDFWEFRLGRALSENKDITRWIVEKYGNKFLFKSWAFVTSGDYHFREDFLVVPILQKNGSEWWWVAKDSKPSDMPALIKHIIDVCKGVTHDSQIWKVLNEIRQPPN